MKKNSINNILLLTGLLSVVSCSKKATDYRSFLDGTELTYPGAISNFKYQPGNRRLQLTWNPSPDPSVSKYVVRWNNNADSLSVNATSHNPADTVKVLIDKLDEYPYTFFINSYDAEGNKSVVGELDNARVYGSVYQGGLHNRMPDPTTPYVYNNNDGTVQLNFSQPDTINITTKISYTNEAGTVKQTAIVPSASSVVLDSHKPGTSVTYQSSYVPLKSAIDTFTTLTVDTFPTIYKLVQCDRSKYLALQRPNDVTAAYGTTFQLMWDGNRTPRGYPDVFNSDGNAGYPRQFTMDLGKVYDLSQMEMVGRTCCHNPTDYQIWGIEDATNAFTTTASNDPNWETEAKSKGWVKLAEEHRTDVESGVTAQGPWTTNIPSTAPNVRYLVVRILKVADGSNEINISQLTFWNRQ